MINNCTKASLFSVICGFILATFLIPPDTANDAVKAENARLVQANKDLTTSLTSAQDRLADLQLEAMGEFRQAKLDLEAEKKRIMSQCTPK